MPEFTHLHVHTQYSILDGASNISLLLQKAKKSGMNALAITDHGNMYGVLKFFNEAKKQGVKPIIGCEVYIALESRNKREKTRGKHYHHLILLAKNKTGYHNLARLTSLGYLEGFYYRPRIDKEILEKYSEGIIVSTACLGGEIPQAIMNHGEEKAQEAIDWFKRVFKDDFYLEMQNHGIAEQKTVNKTLLKLAAQNNIKVIATNDVHYINKEDYDAHDILIRLNTGADINDKKDDLHYSGQEYLKSPEEMAGLFPEAPEAISNTQEILAKIEDYSIHSKIILPTFPLPDNFKDENEYLRHLTYEGAKKFYPDLRDEVKERLDFELSVIKKMGFPGYFLIVQDFINKAREMDVTVGPGRGSAAGSAVAFCTGITSIDPIRYNLLFERFLNPERISMPDIDVDFDDEGRERVLEYVVKKYGKEKVAQIVTFGTMAAKLAIRDVARVLKLPLPDADRLAKMVPERPGITLKQAFKEVPELNDIRQNGNELEKKTLLFAETLEGSARHTGTHACGVIIGPDDLINHVPLATAKDSELAVTQYEGKLVESVGMLKMDFLGLKTLSILNDAIKNIHRRHGIKINIETIPLDDEKTYQLYQRGDTIGTFQFESEGMRNYLKELKPTNIEDLIAMNALYRPGPMEFIPTFIKRKHGKEKVEYPHPLLEDILKPTLGIMVYQEQIMQTAQILGEFPLGKADILRRAMGKKNMEIMEAMKAEFVEGAAKKDIDQKKAEEVFGTMQEFANYGFNRSHSAAYSVIAYQTAYVKAHYPAEYMAAVLTHNLNDIKKITFFVDECLRQNIPVLGPDVNESYLNFMVNDKGEIRFGLAAIKNVGESAAESIISEREENGHYNSIFDFAKRVNLKSVNKRSMESLAMAGAFDGFENTHRAQFFYRENTDDTIFLEKVVKFANDFQVQQNSSQASLFGETNEVQVQDPPMPDCPPWIKLEQLKNEKEVTGFYMSGHPLEDFKLEMDNFCNVSITEIKNNKEKYRNKNVTFAGILTAVNHRTSKTGNAFATFTMEDFTDSDNYILFSEDYLKMKHFLVEGSSLLVKASIVERKFKNGQLDIRINNIILLSEALERNTSEILIKLPLSSITDELVGSLEELTSQAKGNCKLKFQVSDSIEKTDVTLPAPSITVNAVDFLKGILQFEDVEYKLS
ncbi:MAG: DNA polymerase III subunit alpha [Bacteroidales bacterium]|nr:DNA polymerase III subunit alpha [Bacteroidales bacterium]MCF8404651.1 DNA polymerase III subunit alpha [Bacteroidales bacterium]